ncbi:MAG: hypothetical protein HKN26_06620 [Acidimicrobiales bacterium]|nr:hypothetical protein [Acidimicrobiales bacterium]
MSRHMKSFLVILALLLAFAAAPAAAAKGGNGKGGGGAGGDVTGTIELMAVESDDGGAAVAPSYGSTVMFATDINGELSSKSSVYVTVVCMQGAEVVYQYSGSTTSAFLLFDQAGQGLEWNGGAADCSAALVHRVEKGKNTTITYLNTVEFAVAS